VRKRNSPTRDDTLHPGLWLALVVWTTIKGVISIVFTIAIFVGVVSLLVMAGLGRMGHEVLVPNVVGMPLEEAKEAMSEGKFSLEVIREVNSNKTPEGCVMETRPPAGKVVKEGRRIQAVVSLGASDVKVPKIVGHSRETAESRIREAKLTVGTMLYKANSNPRNHVLEQDPAAGSVVSRKHPVNLVLSGGPDYGSTRIGDETLVFRSVVVTVPRGQPLQRVEIEVAGKSPDFKKGFYNRVHRPGDEVKADVYGPRGARLYIIIDKETVSNQKL